MSTDTAPTSPAAAAATGDTARTCVMCGYDLRGLADARCPECGLRFDPHAPPPPRVPWLVRREIGWLRAYWRTVWLVVLRPDRLAEEAWRATRFHADEAASFRRVTALLAAASIAVMLAFGVALEFPNGRQASYEAVMMFLRALGPALAFFWLVTIPTPLQTPAALAGRLALQLEPLRPFGCAGLGLIPAFAVAFAAGTLLDRLVGGSYTDLRIIIVAIGIVTVLAAWCRGSVMYLIAGGRVGGWSMLVMMLHAIVWAIGAFAMAVLVGALTALLFNLIES